MEKKKKKNLNPYLAPYTKITLNWIIDFNVKSKNALLLEEIIGDNLCDFGIYKKIFLDCKKKNHEIKFDEMDIIKISLRRCSLKNIIKKMKRQATE